MSFCLLPALVALEILQGKLMHLISSLLPLALPALGSGSLDSARSGMVQTNMNQGGQAREYRRLNCICQGWT